ncbi:hypothetical protein BUALT_Bualt16G0123900 [Buddleja alternifolia]|uniref:Protein POLYCHOME-like n=1 Tax=Buddleja alternifolia TaxID=168488 RepID=A0AAV6WLP5_9LAMI|nr:hypothetical protein BUALT_Bualt16G0123900 [Buddleja alternifolia]
MPESRDRLSRQDDIVAAYSSRRISNAGNRNMERGSPVIFILQDENEDGQSVGTPFRWRGAAMAGTPGPMGVAAGRGLFGTPRIGRIAPIIGRENLSPVVGSGRGWRSPLPIWYPRRPLNDITSVVRAMERRRDRWRVGEGLLQTESPILQDRIVHRPSVSTSGAHLEHDISMISPAPSISMKRSPTTIIGKVPKILLDITTKNNGESSEDCLTPQKKLLNNIDTVEKVVMEELRKLKRTPLAKRAEREKRVRTLMSMR